MALAPTSESLIAGQEAYHRKKIADLADEVVSLMKSKDITVHEALVCVSSVQKAILDISGERTLKDIS